MPVWNDSVPKCGLADNLSALLIGSNRLCRVTGQCDPCHSRLKGHLQS